MHFTTPSLPLAAFLIASGRLRLLSTTQCGRTVEFVFDDPQQLGEQARLDFAAGAQCPAAAFYESIKRLRQEMTRTLNVNKGATEHNEYLCRH